jgi:hypothetical protein
VTVADLEMELYRSSLIEARVKDMDYAVELYGALCNMRWRKERPDDEDDDGSERWSCSWRYAGGIVAGLRQAGESYLDFYCSGGEGQVTERVREDLAAMGWTPVP